VTCLHFDILGLVRFQTAAGKVKALNGWNVALVTNQHTRSPGTAAPWTARDLSRFWHSQGWVFFFFLHSLLNP